MKNVLFLLIGFLFTLQSFAQRHQPLPSREEELDKKYCSPLFSTLNATYFDLENDDNTASAASYLNILDWLQGRVAGFQVRHYRDLRLPFLRNQPAAIYVDEMRMEPGYLNLLPVTYIALVKIIKSPFVGAWGAPGGVIAIYTKDGEDEEGEE